MTKAAELAKMGEVLTNSQIGGRRNIIINGAMQVAQRSASATGLGDGASYPTVDRFEVSGGSSAGRLTMTQTADGPNGFAKCIKLDCTTADTSIAAGEYLLLNQKIEGQDLQQLKKGTSDAEKVTVSFYVKGNASATYVLELADEDNDRKNTQKFNVTTDWTKVVLTYDGDTTGILDNDNATSLILTIWLHAGSTYSGGTFTSNVWSAMSSANRAVGITSFFDSTDREFFITGLQLEVGSVATPFEHRSFGEELALCQRYYYRVQGSAEANIATGNAWDARSSDYSIRLPTTMRATYTLSVSALTDIIYKYGARSERTDGQYFRLIDSNTLDIASINHQILTNSTTVGYATHLALKDANSYFDFDAEL